ncbi:MAG: GxxExxY protein [bacterium]|mgnify:FL=1|nr:GxxExxY protein [bacterium]
MTDEEAKSICDRIRQVAYDLHVYLGTGYLEKVYENGLAHRLAKSGMEVSCQVPIQVADEDGFVIGEYFADMVVDGIVVELKAVGMLLPIHVAQTINYLKAMNLEHGMLINFGSERFQCRKLARSL